MSSREAAVAVEPHAGAFPAAAETLTQRKRRSGGLQNC